MMMMRWLGLSLLLLSVALAADSRLGCLITTRCEACDPAELAADHCLETGSRLEWTCRQPGSTATTTVREACIETGAQSSLIVFELVCLSLLAVSGFVVRWRKAAVPAPSSSSSSASSSGSVPASPAGKTKSLFAGR